jgi:predicted PurR-regulated permease PerM
MESPKQELVRKRFLLLLTAVISIVFVMMTRQFLVAILLAAIFSGMSHPLYARLVRAFRGRRALASATTLVILILVVLIPLLGLFAIVVAQAISITESVGPQVQALVSQPDQLAERLQALPFYDKIEPYREQILTTVGTIVEGVGGFAIRGLSDMTRGTVNFLFQLFLLLYTMFFFLMDGKKLLNKILYYIPLPHEDEVLLVGRFVSVTRATLKGTLIIGVVQGGLAGAALAVAGIPSAVFWGAVMTVLSIIPGIGTGLVWGPAAIYLLITGDVVSGVLLALFCGLVVGSVDNFLRPRLVGKDTEMHDLLVLFGTLGGILLFGVVGFILGPIIAALFVTVWDIYGVVFKDVLPKVGRLGESKS